ncbi:MAG: hypothetical protein RRY40_01120, partial [Oscillospiraceae bacterium]
MRNIFKKSILLFICGGIFCSCGFTDKKAAAIGVIGGTESSKSQEVSQMPSEKPSEKAPEKASEKNAILVVSFGT